MPQDRGAQSQAVIRLMPRLVAAQATLAALTTLGNAPGQLKAHIEGALNVGLTREEILAHKPVSANFFDQP